VWYYVPVIILGFFPWSAFLIPALGRAWQAAREPQAALLRLCFAWSIVPFIFFSLAQTKLPNYIALMIPAQALLVAVWFDDIVDRADRRWALAWAAFVPATIGGVGVAIRVFSQNNRLSADLHTIVGDIAWLGLTTLTGSILCFWLLARRRTAPFAPVALAAASLGSMFIIAFVAEPHAERFKPIPKLAAAIERERRSGDVITISGVAGSYALEFYTRPRVFVLDTSDVVASGDEAHGQLCTAPRAFLVTSRALSAEMPVYGRPRRELAHEADDVLYLYDGHPCG
jgi:4-amino-4-deoxy-L-arabinose transferase-like glycosyltransferase